MNRELFFNLYVCVVCILINLLIPANAIGIRVGVLYDSNIYDLPSKILSEFGGSGLDVEFIHLDGNTDIATNMANFQDLVAQKVDLVIGPTLPGATNAIAKIANQKEVPTISLSNVINGKEENFIQDSKWLVAFGSIPVAQINMVTNLARIRNLPSRGKNIGIINQGFASKRFVDQLSELTDLVDLPGAADQLNSFIRQRNNIGFITGITQEDVASEIGAIVRNNYRNIPLILFSQPEIKTRAFVAAQIAINSLNRPNLNREAIISAIKSVNRYDKDRGTIELFWSLEFANTGERTAGFVREANRTQKGAQDSTATKECSCKDSNGNLIKCKDCQEGDNCEKTNEGSEDCTTKCR